MSPPPAVEIADICFTPSDHEEEDVTKDCGISGSSQHKQDRARKARESREQRRKQSEERLSREVRQGSLVQERRDHEVKSGEERVAYLEKVALRLERELAETKEANEKRKENARNQLDKVQAQEVDLRSKLDRMLDETAHVSQDTLTHNDSKIAGIKKLIGSLRTENKTVRDKTESVKIEIAKARTHVNDLARENASVEASLESLEKKKKSLSAHGSKLSDSLKKLKSYNAKLMSEHAHRSKFYEAETNIRKKYEDAVSDIINLLAERSEDPSLLDEVVAARDCYLHDQELRLVHRK